MRALRNLRREYPKDAYDVLPEGQCPHPRRSTAETDFKDAANYNAVGKHVVVVVAPFAGWARSRCTFFEDEVVLFHVS